MIHAWLLRRYPYWDLNMFHRKRLFVQFFHVHLPLRWFQFQSKGKNYDAPDAPSFMRRKPTLRWFIWIVCSEFRTGVLPILRLGFPNR
jgi:hypothetical protein